MDSLDSREIRIFISSTFIDMDKERDALVSTVFPYLKKIASERQVTLTEIDLRTGVSAKEARSNKIVEICLDEINKSHPFFIGILGGRYGWVPLENKADWDTILPDRYKDVIKDISDGISMTELEIQYGVLRNPNKIHGGFYLLDCPESQIEPKQKALRDLVNAQTRYSCKPYKTVEELSQIIIADFTDVINSLFPIEQSQTWEATSQVEKAAMIERTRYYVPREDIEKQIWDFLQSDYSICALTGPSGMGKTATLSRIALDALNNKNFDTIPIFSSNTTHSATIEDLANYLCNCFAHLYDIHYDSNKNPIAELGRIAESFQSPKTLCIIIDGINQFTSGDNNPGFSWWPQWGDNVKIIMSLPNNDPLFRDLELMGCYEITMGRMVIDQRLMMAESYFEPFRKMGILTSENRQILAGDNPILYNTFVYATILDEIRRYGSYDTLHSFIKRLVAFTTEKELFKFVLQRQVDLFMPERKDDLLKKVLSYIAISEEGLSEEEIMRLAGGNRLDTSRILCLNDLFLFKREGRIVFSHRIYEQSVWDFFLKDRDFEGILRSEIIHLYLQEEDNSRRYFEVAYQYYNLKDWNNLYKWICNENMASFFASNRKMHLLAKYWSRLLKEDPYKYDVLGYSYNSACLDNSLNILINDTLRDILLPAHCNTLLLVSSMFSSYIPRSSALQRILNGIRKMLENKNDDEYEEIKSSVQRGENVSFRMGKQWKKALTGHLELLKTEVKDLSDSEVLNVGELLLSMYEDCQNEEYLTDAIDILQAALSARIKKYGESHVQVAIAYSNYGSAIYRRNPKIGLENLQKSLDIYRKEQGQYSLDAAIDCHNIAMLLRDSDPHSAVGYAEQALEIYLKLFGDESYEVTQAYFVLGITNQAAGRKEAAVDSLMHVIRTMYSYPEMASEYAYISQLAFYTALDVEQYEVALSVIDLFLESIDETDIESHIRWSANRGEVFLRINEIEQLKQCYEEAIALSHDNGLLELELEMGFYYGKALCVAGDNESAIEQLSIVISKGDEYGLSSSSLIASALFNRAEINISLNSNLEESITDIQRAISIQSSFANEDDSIEEYYRVLQFAQSKIDSRVNGDSSECDVSEDVQEMAELLSDKSLLDEFKVAMDSFSRGVIDTAISRLNYLRQVIPDDNPLAQAMVLRYLAYSYERKANNSNSGSISRDTIIELYENAINLAEDEGNPTIAGKTSHDLSEYAWSIQEYHLAEINYLRELLFFLLRGEFATFPSVVALSNLSQALLRQQDFCDWNLLLSICSLGLFIMKQGSIDDEDLYRIFNRTIDSCLEQLGICNDDFRVDFGRDALCLSQYLIKLHESRLCTLSSQLLAWATKLYSQRERFDKVAEVLSLLVESERLAVHFENARTYAEYFNDLDETPEKVCHRKRVGESLVKIELSLLSIAAAHDISVRYGLSEEWFDKEVLNYFPCYSYLQAGDKEKAERRYKQHLSETQPDLFSLCDMFYYEKARGNKLESASYYKKIKQMLSTFDEETAQLIKPALKEMNN